MDGRHISWEVAPELVAPRGDALPNSHGMTSPADPLDGFGHVDDAIRDILLRYVRPTHSPEPHASPHAGGGSAEGEAPAVGACPSFGHSAAMPSVTTHSSAAASPAPVHVDPLGGHLLGVGGGGGAYHAQHSVSSTAFEGSAADYTFMYPSRSPVTPAAIDQSISVVELSRGPTTRRLAEEEEAEAGMFGGHGNGKASNAHYDDAGDADADWGNLALEVTARLHWRSAAAQQCLNRWAQRCAARQSTRRTLLLTADAYHSRWLVFASFRRWQGRHQRRYAAAQQEEIAARNYSLTLMARPFLAWRCLALGTRRRQREGLAEIYHAAAARGAGRCWDAWLGFWHSRRLAAQLAALSAYRLQRRFFAAWRAAGERRVAQQFALGVFGSKRRLQSAFAALVKWRARTHQRRATRLLRAECAAETMAKASVNRHLALRFAPWRAAAASIVGARKATLLEGRSNALLARRAFGLWGQWAALRRAEATIAAACALRAKSAAFGVWVARRREAVELRGREAAADLFFSALNRHKHLVAPFLAWRGLCHASRRARVGHADALALRRALVGDVAVEALRRYAHLYLPHATTGGWFAPAAEAPWHRSPPPLSAPIPPSNGGGRRNSSSPNPFLSVRHGEAHAANMSGGGGSGVGKPPLSPSPMLQSTPSHSPYCASAPSVSASGGRGSASRQRDASSASSFASSSNSHALSDADLDGFGALLRRQRSPIPLRGPTPPLPAHPPQRAQGSSPPHIPITPAGSNANGSLLHTLPSASTPHIQHATAALRRRAAEYTVLRQAEGQWAAELGELAERCAWMEATGEGAGAEAFEALAQARHRMAFLRGQQAALGALREEIVATRAAISIALAQSTSPAVEGSSFSAADPFTPEHLPAYRNAGMADA